MRMVVGSIVAATLAVGLCLDVHARQRPVAPTPPSCALSAQVTCPEPLQVGCDIEDITFGESKAWRYDRMYPLFDGLLRDVEGVSLHSLSDQASGFSTGGPRCAALPAKIADLANCFPLARKGLFR